MRELFPFQLPLIDADGNGIPNELSDAAIASQRGFAYAGTLGESWPPYIVENQAKLTVTNQRGQIRAEVRDDKKVRNVWAVIYTASYPGFDEVGVYKVVIHANDSDDLVAQPKVLVVDVGYQLYLPMIER